MQADLGVVVSVCAFRIVIYLLTVGYSHVLMNGFRIYDGKRYGFQGNVHKLIAISRWEIAYIVDQDQNVGLNRPPTSDFRRT